jgi:hypothetical protein
MAKHQVLLSLSILLITLMAWNPGAAENLGPISEETPPAICDSGSFISGIRCTGGYCDNIKIFCTRIADAALGHGSWTAWFSEEEGRRECPPSHLIAGLACQGSYCDNISLYCVEVTNMRAESCRDTSFVSEERGGSLSFLERTEVASRILFAKSVRCSGRYCDNVSFNVCQINK